MTDLDIADDRPTRVCNWILRHIPFSGTIERLWHTELPALMLLLASVILVATTV
ncbi:MAG: hypothetical protein ACK5O2_02725 [Microthrixaceae bacterium]